MSQVRTANWPAGTSRSSAEGGPGAILHGGPRVRIHLPPAVRPLRTGLPRSVGCPSAANGTIPDVPALGLKRGTSTRFTHYSDLFLCRPEWIGDSQTQRSGRLGVLLPALRDRRYPELINIEVPDELISMILPMHEGQDGDEMIGLHVAEPQVRAD